MGHGHLLLPDAARHCDLAAVVDLASRRVLSHGVSITMEAGFCVEAIKETLAKHGNPEIFNTDQGNQFTSLDFTRRQVAISMDGEGATGITISYP